MQRIRLAGNDLLRVLKCDICLLGLAAASLYLLSVPHWPIFVSILGACLFRPKHKWHFMMVGTLWSWIFTQDLKWQELAQILKALGHDASMSENWLFRVGVILAVQTLCFCFLKLIERIGMSRYQAFLLLISIYFLSIYLVSLVTLNNNFGVFIWGMLLAYQRFFWFLGFAVIERDEKRQTNFGLLQQLSLFQPFWGNGYDVPIPGGTIQLTKLEAKAESDIQLIRWSGVKLLYWVLIVGTFCDLFVWGLGIDHAIRDRIAMWFLPVRANAYSLLISKSLFEYQFIGRTGDTFDFFARWFFFLTNTYIRILRNFLMPTGIGVALLRINGFPAFRHVYNPLKADLFAHYFARWLYYYNQLISKFFLIPIFVRIRIANQSLRYFITLFFAVFFTGVTFHTGARFLSTLAIDGFSGFFNRYVYCFPYFLILSLVVSFSGTFERRCEKSSSRYLIGLRVMLYAFVFALVLYWTRLFEWPNRAPDLARFLQFFGSLFVIGGPI